MMGSDLLVKILLNSVIKKLFVKKIPKISEKYVPYVEKDTECDKCEYLSECIHNEHIDCTTSQDTRSHVLCDMTRCKKKGVV